MVARLNEGCEGSVCREEFLLLVIKLVADGMVEEQGTLHAAVGSMEAAGRDLQGPGGRGEENEPVWILPAYVEQLEEAIPLDHSVVVSLVTVCVPLLQAKEAIGRADRLASMLNQVHSVGVGDTDVRKVHPRSAAEGSFGVEVDHGAL